MSKDVDAKGVQVKGSPVQAAGGPARARSRVVLEGRVLERLVLVQTPRGVFVGEAIAGLAQDAPEHGLEVGVVGGGTHHLAVLRPQRLKEAAHGGAASLEAQGPASSTPNLACAQEFNPALVLSQEPFDAGPATVRGRA
jgi:hypothetical protein